MGRARTLGHPRGGDLCPRRAGEPGALANERASTETRVRESDDSRRSRAGANRRTRPRGIDFERFRIDSHARQPVVRSRTNIGVVGTVRGVAVRIECAVQSTPRRLSANRSSPADIRSRGPTPDALMAPNSEAPSAVSVFARDCKLAKPPLRRVRTLQRVSRRPVAPRPRQPWTRATPDPSQGHVRVRRALAP